MSSTSYIEDRMTVVQLPAGSRTTATYDGDGSAARTRREEVTVPGFTRS